MRSPIHHVTVEIERGQLNLAKDFYGVLGFIEVRPPDEIALRTSWLEREGVQIHLMFAEDPEVHQRTHFAIVVPEFDQSLNELEALGYIPEERRKYWESPRAFVRDPAGNLVELMQFAPNSN